MTKIAELVAQRARAFDEFKVLAEKPTLSEAELAEYETKKRAVTDLDAQLVRAKEAQALSASTAQPVAGQETPENKPAAKVETDKYVKERSLVIGAAAKMMAYGGGNLFSARQASMEVYGESHPVTRALVASTGPAGGFIVPPDYMNEIIELLRPAAVVRGSNPRVIPMPRGTMTLPGQASPATATYGSEGSQIASSQQSLKQIVASFKKLTALVPISNDLMRYADPAQTGRCKRQRKIGVPQLETAVGGRNEIEDASRVWWECARPDWTRRFIRGLAEDAKFELSRGVIIDPAVKAGFGETRRRGYGATGGCENRGNLGIHRQRCRRSGESGQPEDQQQAALEEVKIRGNPKIQRRESWKVREPGQPGDPPTGTLRERGFGATRRLTVGTAGRCRIRGNPKTHREARLEERRFGATRRFTRKGSPMVARFEETRRSIAGTAGRCRMRGNPEPHRKAGRDDAWFMNL
jgi:hypothetical protein